MDELRGSTNLKAEWTHGNSVRRRSIKSLQIAKHPKEIKSFIKRKPSQRRMLGLYLTSDTVKRYIVKDTVHWEKNGKEPR